MRYVWVLLLAMLLVPNTVLADELPPVPVCGEGAVDCAVLYLPTVGVSDWVTVNFRHVSCTGEPIVGRTVIVDPYDGMAGYELLTDSDGVARWEGRTDTFMRFIGISYLTEKTYVATAFMAVQVQYCPAPVGPIWEFPYK